MLGRCRSDISACRRNESSRLRTRWRGYIAGARRKLSVAGPEMRRTPREAKRGPEAAADTPSSVFRRFLVRPEKLCQGQTADPFAGDKYLKKRPRISLLRHRPVGAARKLPACRRQAPQQLPVYTPSRPSGKVTDVSSETAQPASRKARWIYPGFAECRARNEADRASRNGEREQKEGAAPRMCPDDPRAKFESRASSGAGQRLNGNIGCRSAGRNECDLLRTPGRPRRHAQRKTGGGGQASILRE
ncbi:hypothetical protein MRX96_019218 [Rhipicephalus microplus]